MRKISIKGLKKKLEALQKIRTIQLYGKDCFTCPQKDLEGANCQLGHGPWPRPKLSIECKFSTRFTRIQCFRCNINHGGMGYVFGQNLKKQGENLEELEEWNQRTKGEEKNRKWYEDAIHRYNVDIEKHGTI